MAIWANDTVVCGKGRTACAALDLATGGAVREGRLAGAKASGTGTAAASGGDLGRWVVLGCGLPALERVEGASREALPPAWRWSGGKEAAAGVAAAWVAAAEELAAGVVGRRMERRCWSGSEWMTVLPLQKAGSGT